MKPYRILFAPDGHHYVDSPDNDREDPAEAIQEARDLLTLNTNGECKLVNTLTKFEIWDSRKERKDYPECVIQLARKQHQADVYNNSQKKKRRR